MYVTVLTPSHLTSNAQPGPVGSSPSTASIGRISVGHRDASINRSCAVPRLPTIDLVRSMAPTNVTGETMDPTARVPLGRTGLMVTRLGLGLGPIGGLYEAVGDVQAVATVDRAWQRGLRLFDTAPLYGYGLSDRRAGAAVAVRPPDDPRTA